LKFNLTEREQEIVELIVQGYSNKQVSHKLCVREQTVKNRLGNIFKKLGIHNRINLAVSLLGDGLTRHTTESITKSSPGPKVIENSEIFKGSK